VRVIREVDACCRVGGASAGIDAERADFPVGGNGPNHEEDKDQGGKEEQEAEPPPAATVPFVVGARHDDYWRRHDDGLPKHQAGWGCGGDGPRKHEAGWGCDHAGLRRRGAGWRWGYEGLRRCRRGSGGGILRSRLRFRWLGLNRRARLGRGATTGQVVKPRLELRLIGSEILRLSCTPWEEAHVRPR
jgi:hypothetical protein